MSNQRGFTLVEVMVVTLIGFGILVGLTSLYMSGQRTYLQSTVQLQSQRDASMISDEFAVRARYASSATVTGGTSVLFLSAVPFEELGLRANLPQEPLPLLTWRVLSLVPDIVAVGTVLLGGVWWITHRREDVAAAEAKEKTP